MKIRSSCLAFSCATAFLFSVTPGIAHAEDFNGPYIGAEAGIGILDTEGSTIAGPFENTDTSAVVGAVLGYRTPLGTDSRVIVGIEGNLGLYTDGSDARYGVSGIGGYRIGDNGLAYLRAGYGWRDGVQTGAGKGIDGLVLGGGYEFGLTKNVSLRLDYKYLDYGDVNFPDNTVDFSGHEVTGGVLFNF